MARPHFVYHLSTDGHLGGLPSGAVVNHAAKDIHVFNSLGQIPRSRTPGSCRNSNFVCVFWATSCCMQDLSSQTGTEPVTPALGAQTLNQRPTREVPTRLTLEELLKCSPECGPRHFSDHSDSPSGGVQKAVSRGCRTGARAELKGKVEAPRGRRWRLGLPQPSPHPSPQQPLIMPWTRDTRALNGEEQRVKITANRHLLN